MTALFFSSTVEEHLVGLRLPHLGPSFCTENWPVNRMPTEPTKLLDFSVETL